MTMLLLMIMTTLIIDLMMIIPSMSCSSQPM